MRRGFQVNALREILLWGWMGVSGVWGEEISLREGAEAQGVTQETKNRGMERGSGEDGF